MDSTASVTLKCIQYCSHQALNYGCGNNSGVCELLCNFMNHGLHCSALMSHVVPMSPSFLLHPSLPPTLGKSLN